MRYRDRLIKALWMRYGRFAVARDGIWFVDIPRTSSSSIRAELGTQFGSAHGKRKNDTGYSTKQLFPSHIPAQEMRSILGDRIWQRILTFSVVRNPWDRLLSFYLHRLKARTIPTDLTFREYVVGFREPERHGDRYGPLYRRSCADYLVDGAQIIVARVIKYEERLEALTQLGAEIGCTQLGQAHTQKTLNDSHYSNHYDTEMRAIVAELFKQDIELFGYAFETQDV